MDVEYKLSPQVTNEEMNALFADTWPGPHKYWDFAPVLQCSLGYVCAYHNDQLIGFANVAWDGGAHAFLLDPTVRSDCQRKGIGRELVRRAEELARKNGVEWLHVDFEPRLEVFYQKCGFRESHAGLINLRECEEHRTT
jgi:GNAT superfamily N-acetyltransferase